MGTDRTSRTVPKKRRWEILPIAPCPWENLAMEVYVGVQGGLLALPFMGLSWTLSGQEISQQQELLPKEALHHR